MTLADGRLFYRTPPPPEPFDASDVLMEAIRERIHDRRWYRCQPRPGYWRDFGHENDVALRALVAVARRARRLAAEADVPIDTRGWTEAESRAMWGDR